MTRDEQAQRDQRAAEMEVKYGGVYPCPKCGMMTYPSREHKCPATKIKEAHPLKWDLPPGTTVHMDTGTPPRKMRSSEPRTREEVDERLVAELGAAMRGASTSARLRVPEIKPNPAQEADATALATAALKANPLPAQPEKDKSLIWDDCPACAYKHLTAAYAALTSLGARPYNVTAEEVYHARAEIALQEAAMGYSGNFALAMGCLAMAETVSDSESSAQDVRKVRLALLEGRPSWIILPPLSAEALAIAHITEAARELPALSNHIIGCLINEDGSANLAECMPELVDDLRLEIKWLADTYELNKGTNA